MNILSHRGYWKYPQEKNTFESFKRSFELGFGTETDIRDHNGEIIISHDIPLSDNLFYLSDFLKLYNEFRNKDLFIALNVKADGLQNLVRDTLEKYNIENYRLFDMSVPDMKVTNETNLNFLTRTSDLEPLPLLLDQAKGIWLDCFDSIWYDIDLINQYVRQNKEVWVVSPELHNREYLNFWQQLKVFFKVLPQSIFLCTDYPEQARSFFYD